MDCVVLGAEGVCESGGIINQLGTLTLAIVAQQVILLCACVPVILLCACAGNIVL